MKRPWMLAVLAVLGGIALWMHWPRGLPRLDLPEALTLEQLQATPDGTLITVATTEVRYRVVAIPERMPQWRELPEPARNLLALSWTEADDNPGAPDHFLGFATHFRYTSPYLAEPEEIATAYEAIGAPAVAEVMRAAGKRAAEQPKPDPDAEPGPPPAGVYDDLDRRFCAARREARIAPLMRAYIRANIESIADAHLSGGR